MYAKLITSEAGGIIPQAFHCIGYGRSPGGNCFDGVVPSRGICEYGHD
jgi:hypothetical protein